VSTSKTVVHLAGAVALLLGLDAYAHREIRSVRTEIRGTDRSIAAEVAKVRRAAAEADHAQQQTTARLETDLAAAPVEMTAAARGAGIEAQRHALLLARRMAQAHRKQIERADTELASIRAAAEATGETARQLRSELHAARSAAKAGGVQAELARAERALETLHQDIRENGAELAAVRGSARRETLPFRAGKAAPGAETGGLAIRLRTIDAKWQHYTLQVTAAGGRPERRDGTIHEPIHFRIPGAGISCELIVNEIAKDEVSGLVTVARNSELARGYSIGSAETKNLPGR